MESREWKWKMVKTAIDFMHKIIEITSLTSKWQKKGSASTLQLEKKSEGYRKDSLDTEAILATTK